MAATLRRCCWHAARRQQRPPDVADDCLCCACCCRRQARYGLCRCEERPAALCVLHCCPAGWGPLGQLQQHPRGLSSRTNRRQQKCHDNVNVRTIPTPEKQPAERPRKLQGRVISSSLSRGSMPLRPASRPASPAACAHHMHTVLQELRCTRVPLSPPAPCTLAGRS